MDKSAPGRRDGARRAASDQLRALAILGGTVVLAAVTATLAGPWRAGLREFAPADPSAIAPSAAASASISAPPASEPPLPEMSGGEWPGAVLLTVMALIGLFIVVMVVRWLARSARQWLAGVDAAPPQPGPDPGMADESAHIPADEELDDEQIARLSDAIDHAGAHLQAAVPPSDAVIAAWLSLEDAAATIGVRRDPSQTTTELVVTLLGRTSADPDATGTLLRLYHAARFSTHPVTAADVTAAADALRRVQAGLQAATPVTAATAPDQGGDA